jgi:hypothetical protein
MVEFLNPDSDLVQEAIQLIKIIPINVSLQWVEGHYSGDSPTLAQRLNQRAHKLAKSYLKHPDPLFIPSTKVLPPPSETVYISFENSNITSKLSTLTRQQLHTEPLIKTICKNTKWSKETFNSVDWEAYGEVFSNLPRTKQISLSKITHGLINTNAQNHKFYGSSGLCPCCSSQHETIFHMLTCPEESVAANRKAAMEALWSNIKKIETHKDILECLKYGLSQWSSSSDGDPLTMRAPTSSSIKPLDMALTQAFRSQNTIAWEHLLRGRISIHWRKAFTLTQTNKQSKKVSATTWSSNLIGALLLYTSSLWKFWNGVLHGHTLEEEDKKKRETLSINITNAYTAYETAKFIVSRHLSSLFDKHIQYILKSDTDYLQCWLNTYDEAVKTQSEDRHRQSIAAKNFFKPRKPTQAHCRRAAYIP